MKISNKNIRATALQEFWSEEYPDSLYLWQGAKHNSTLADIEKSKIPTHKDLFSTQEEIQKGHEFCKSFYYQILPELAGRLNKVHNLDLSVSFWQTTFGYWLYRHISVVYDKYVYLSGLDIDSTGIKLLNKRDFYIPQNHSDYIFCFAGDFGVQQLVSQYYYLYKTKEFSLVNSRFSYGNLTSNNDAFSTRIKRKLSLLRVEPQVALLNVHYAEKVLNFLQEKSQEKISNFILPVMKVKSRVADFSKRRCIANCVIEDSFESYLIQSLYYCLPRDFLENFKEYYNVFQKDIESRKFTHIVSENWISNIPNAIYVALAMKNKRTFITNEHAAGTFFYKNLMQFIDYDVADIYLSVGWKKNSKNFVQGGFACRDVIPYEYDQQKKTILYISHTRFIYWQAFNETHATNSTFIKRLNFVAKILELFPPELKANLLFRPRKGKLFWDVEGVLELDKHNIKIDRSDFSKSISQSRIVIIDHISTGLAEILLMNVPFILVYDVNFIPLSDELQKIFDDLINCGVIHTSAQSAVAHLSSIYDDVEGWWNSEIVCRPVKQLTEISLAPANKTTDYFLSLLSEDFITTPALFNRFWAWIELCAKLMYRLTNKMKSLISLM